MPLSLDQVRWIAHLARLEMSAADQQVMAQQLSALLDYVDQLSEVETGGVEPLNHPLEVQSVFRPDEPAPSVARGRVAPPEAAVFDAPQS